MLIPPDYRESLFERTTRYVGLFLLAPPLLVLALTVALSLPHQADYGFSIHRLTVVAVAPHGPAASQGVQVGDRVIAVGGHPTPHMHDFYAARTRAEQMAPTASSLFPTISFTFSGVEDARRELQITPVRISQAYLIHRCSLWVAGLSFLLIGWWVLWRQHDPVSRNFFSVCLIFGFFLLDIPDHPSELYMLAKDYLRNLLQLLLPGYFLRFFFQFPTPRRRRSGAVKKYRLLMLPGLAIFGLIVGLDHLPEQLQRPTAVTWLAAIYAIGYFLLGLIVFGRRVLRRDRPIQQTKLRVVLVGLVAGLLPFLVAIIFANFLPDTAVSHWQYLGLSLLLVPVSFGLAIMRYGALDTGFVVRVSLIYGVLTLVVILGYFLIVGVVGNLIADFFDAETWPVLVFIAAGSGLVIMPLRNLVQLWIDGVFYPARRASRQAINDLAEHLSGLIELPDVVEMIRKDICALYRPETFALLLSTSPENKDYSAQVDNCQAHLNENFTRQNTASLSCDSDLARLLNILRRPLFREELEDQMLAREADSESLRLLVQLNTALIVPLITGNRLLGLMSFGPKQGGELYSQDDIANLRSLAVHAASQIESRQLYQASLGRKRLETELKVARDLQAHLLPEAALATASFAISGKNEPCRMVGGDYFDYFTLDNGDLYFAIADVSGKGIPAALMMTSVRVAFRQEAAAGLGPRALIQQLNEVALTLGAPGHFICFFCGLWSPHSGILRYCNAGMEPPVLFRPHKHYREILKIGGPVLGVEKKVFYREGTTRLEPSDRVFLYTDGLTEERSPNGEFFDTPRLITLVESHLTASPDRLLRQVFSQVSAFGGSERSDDRTAIILEIK